ncbi:hypothetical protein Tco_0144037 [Tanacetum coccineum]
MSARASRSHNQEAIDVAIVGMLADLKEGVRCKQVVTGMSSVDDNYNADDRKFCKDSIVSTINALYPSPLWQLMATYTTNWNAKDIDNIIRVLHVFYLASGLKINIHKSNIYGIGVNKDEVLSMASNAGCIAGDIPFNYLSLPISSNMKSIASWKTLVDRFHMRLSSWKANLLSIGGRLTLIKSVLGSLGIYYLSIFRAPESVLQDLERIRAKA